MAFEITVKSHRNNVDLFFHHPEPEKDIVVSIETGLERLDPYLVLSEPDWTLQNAEEELAYDLEEEIVERFSLAAHEMGWSLDEMYAVQTSSAMQTAITVCILLSTHGLGHRWDSASEP